MSIVHGYCRTNLDGYEREEWPTEFVAVPRIGERVAAVSGRTLRVVQITHSIDKRDQTPRIEVELHR